MYSKIKIFEPIYKENQVLSESDFFPLVRKNNIRPEWREFQILIDIYRQKKYLESDFVGVFSPKFNLKCKIKASQFIDFISANPNKDVYFINPFPQIPYWSFNVWMQGECAHPGLCSIAQKLFDICNINLRIDNVPRHGPDILLYSNFWVGSPKFWEIYVGGWLSPIAEFLENNPNHPVARAVMEQTTHTDPAPFLPFIIERLFSTFLSFNKELDFISYEIEEDRIPLYCTTNYEKLLYERMRDQINKADLNNKFSEPLISKMKLLTVLCQQHCNDFFAISAHPHSGKAIIGKIV